MYTYDKLKEICLKKSFPFYTKNLDLNIIGIRNLEGREKDNNTFNDVFCFIYLEGGQKIVHTFKGTTEGGYKPRLNPSNSKGLAIMVPGHYKKLWTFGKHKGQYDAFVQLSPVSVYRDNNKDNILDFEPSSIETGMYGINMHRANQSQTSTYVENWSEGCQVFADPKDFDKAMSIYNAYRKLWGDAVSYTLLLSTEFK